MKSVITGDLVHSSHLSHQERARAFDILKNTFTKIEREYGQAGNKTAFAIFRGDSFQGLIEQPSLALKITLLIRSKLRAAIQDESTQLWDARIAIGLGPVEYPSQNILESDGTAFRNSGPFLDQLKKDQRLIITTPDESYNKELKTSTVLANALINQWTYQQSEIIYEILGHKNQTEIARDYAISQSAVNQRLKSANWDAIEVFMERYSEIAHRLNLNL
ncbi:MAG: SatD family protein [Candidatus Cyclobacteriaceae bacterium M3_2C_046]